MTFVNPANLVSELELEKGSTVADFGCGAGFFCIPAAKKTGGTGVVYAVDILRPKLEATLSRARHAGLTNIVPLHADLEKPLESEGLAHSSCDWVLMSNVVHQVRQLPKLLANAYKVLKTGGKIFVLEWKKNASVLGSSGNARVGEEDLRKACEEMGLRPEKTLSAGPFHYAMVFVK